MKYQDFDRYDFLKDEFFVGWVKRPSAESDRFWQTWLKRFPHKRAEVEAARQMLGTWAYPAARVSEEDANEVLENILHRVSFRALRDVPRQRIGYWQGAVAAAMLVMGLAIGGWWQLRNEKKPEVPITTVVMTVRDNPPGMKSVLRMGDGTVIHLNANSRLTHPERFATDQREVWLEGEAFFEVAHDPTRPFTVHSGDLSTTVLGTSFNMRAGKTDEEKWAVSLVTGKVVVMEKMLIIPCQTRLISFRANNLPIGLLREARKNRASIRIWCWLGIIKQLYLNKLIFKKLPSNYPTGTG